MVMVDDDSFAYMSLLLIGKIDTQACEYKNIAYIDQKSDRKHGGHR